jgi:type II secretory pathway predicted ATPase ExeA
MFKQFFGMKFNPFEKDVQTGDMYRGEDIKELESRLKYMLECRGLFLLVGEPGSGKTAALRKFVTELGASLYRPLYLPLTTLTVNDFYSAMAALLGESPKFRKIDMFRQIQSAVKVLFYEQRITPVFIVDEVHMASSAILDDIRMLFNFNMDSVNPYILILAGQPLIRNKLSLNICVPLKQRIASRYSMKGMSILETAEYLATRMELAGVSRTVFTEQAVSGIHSCSNGFPRNINNIATHALTYSAWKQLDMVDEEAVYQANIEISA